MDGVPSPDPVDAVANPTVAPSKASRHQPSVNQADTAEGAGPNASNPHGASPPPTTANIHATPTFVRHATAPGSVAAPSHCVR